MADAMAMTALGRIDGISEGCCAVFRGVPYALPPTGERRFAPPAPVPAWTGTLVADRNSPIAPQRPSRLDRVMGGFDVPAGEDCLTLTIWTPGCDTARRPVLVWLHGGAFVSGAGSLAWYDGGALAAAGDVVVVGVNYRLGALGFLFRTGLIEENLGLLDQVAALRWVHAHIAAFGGDPDAITLGGQSAGASSTTALLADPATRPLIRRAILQSGSFGRPPRTPAQADDFADRFMAKLGIDPDAPDRMARLRTAAVDAILDVQHALMAETGDLVFRPVARHGETTAADLVARATEATAGVTVLAGITSGEGYAYFGGLDVTIAQAEAAIGAEPGGAEALRRLRARLPGADGVTLMSEHRSDTGFTLGFIALAQGIAETGGRCFGYVFDWHPPGSPFRACHCIELPFTLGNRPLWGESPMLAGGDAAEIAGLSAVMVRAWTSFIRTGTPTLGPDLPPWPAMTADRPDALVLGRRLALRSLRSDLP